MRSGHRRSGELYQNFTGFGLTNFLRMPVYVRKSTRLRSRREFFEVKSLLTAGDAVEIASLAIRSG
jgi:hypothetical protein